MLVNLTPNLAETKRRFEIAKKHNFEHIAQFDKRLNTEVGIYQCNFGHNFSFEEFEEFKDNNNLPYENCYSVFAPDYNKSQYGVADSLEQLKEYFKEQIEDKSNKYILTLTPVYQDLENRGKGDGWRWHKWGEYIGKLDSKCEYLDDEDFGEDFEYIICFHLYKIN